MANAKSPLHLLRILDVSGHTEVAYDPADSTAVREVEERFNDLMKRNFVAFDLSTQPGKLLRRFDPEASEIIVSHQFAGG